MMENNNMYVFGIYKIHPQRHIHTHLTHKQTHTLKLRHANLYIHKELHTMEEQPVLGLETKNIVLPRMGSPKLVLVHRKFKHSKLTHVLYLHKLTHAYMYLHLYDTHASP